MTAHIKQCAATEIGMNTIGAQPKSRHRRAVHAALRRSAAEGNLCVRLSGACMQPLLNDGQRVYVKRHERYWPGDVLIIQSADGRYLCHRFIGWYRRKGMTRWLTQADMARRPDYSVTSDAILGCPQPTDSGRPMPIRWRDRSMALLRYMMWAASAVFRRVNP